MYVKNLRKNNNKKWKFRDLILKRHPTEHDRNIARSNRHNQNTDRTQNGSFTPYETTTELYTEYRSNISKGP